MLIFTNSDLRQGFSPFPPSQTSPVHNLTFIENLAEELLELLNKGIDNVSTTEYTPKNG